MTKRNKGPGYVGYFDACMEPCNPGGTSGIGAVIFQGKDRVWEKSELIPARPDYSNNVAEYIAFISILDWLLERDLRVAPITVYGDSQLVIKQCFGGWRIKGGMYAPFARDARVKVAKFKRLKGVWIPRDMNTIADELSKAELRKAGIAFRLQREAA